MYASKRRCEENKQLLLKYSNQVLDSNHAKTKIDKSASKHKVARFACRSISGNSLIRRLLIFNGNLFLGLMFVMHGHIHAICIEGCGGRPVREDPKNSDVFFIGKIQTRRSIHH